MAKKLDLNKLKDEIHKEKQNRNVTSSHLGESVGAGVSPRDVFLHGLLHARETGQETPSSTLLKVVENKVTEKHGGVHMHKVNEAASTAPVAVATPPTQSPDRDEQLFADLDKKRKQTLAESIANFQGNAPVGEKPPAVNYNGQQFLTSVPNNAPTGAPMQINEAALVENVKNVVNNYLTENLGGVFEEAIKGTIIEMYAVERIQEVLNENRDLIKTVVIETIKEIRDKSKPKG
jgi:hypothetical protein